MAFQVITALWMASQIGQVASPPINVRVAIIAYEDFHSEVAKYEELFSQLSHHDPAFHFQMAVGSYGEVVHWIDRQTVDLAILTPGVFASLLSNSNGTTHSPNCQYLATMQLPAARSRWATDQRQADGLYDHYGSVCLVTESSTLQSVEELRQATSKNQVEFLFVHPMSVSGRIAPTAILQGLGITPTREQVRFTYSHTQSLRILADPITEKERIAFVWDDAAGNDTDLESGIRRLPFPELEALQIPHDVVVASNEFQYGDHIRTLLLNQIKNGPFQFTQVDNWASLYEAVNHWVEVSNTTLLTDQGEHVSLDEIAHSLLQYARSQPHPPRLALVLSGGGAKCSYQVGAVQALEEKIAELHERNPEQDIDIELVVGTSGGAINSLPMAMKIGATDQGQKILEDTWHALDQRDIVRPSFLVRANMGLWFAIVQTALIIWAVRWFVPQIERRGKTFAITYTVVAALEILLGYLPGSPWHWLGTNHVLHHAWLWFSFGVRTSAWSLFAIGIGAIFLESRAMRRGQHISIPKWFTKTTLLAGVLGLPIIQWTIILLHEETLSGGQGMERALADKIPALIDKHLAHHDLSPLEKRVADKPHEMLRNVSRQIIQRNLLERDLVITGSCLGQTSEDLPTDLYFYASADPAAPLPTFGERWLSLRQHPEILLDVIMGSSSIYPVFPPRRILNVPRSGEAITLVDGGFAHNSPLEAAVLWGATHVLLIEATPRRRSQQGNFLRNITSSFRHLHRQAQLLDARSRGKVVVYNLAPDPPHMCVLDFSHNLVADSIRRGYRDASMEAGLEKPRFLRELGEPIFRDTGISHRVDSKDTTPASP